MSEEELEDQDLGTCRLSPPKKRRPVEDMNVLY
jgi:hypothetical protein